jgi:hypothetical protein
MTSETDSLLTKTLRIATFTFTLSIRILRRAQESDRMVHIHVQGPPDSNHQEVKSIFPGFSSVNSYWPAKIFTMNCTKIITFKPSTQNPTTKNH